MDIPLTESDIKNNLSVLNNSETLMSIKLISEDKELSQYLLNLLNEEYINDRKNFILYVQQVRHQFFIIIDI